MSRESVIRNDPFARTTTVLHEDVDGKTVVETRQDIEPILAANAEHRKVTQGQRFGGDGGRQHLAARIPMVIVMQLHRQGILRDAKEFTKWLARPENAIFRTRG